MSRKASFKAIRETIGISQDVFAIIIGRDKKHVQHLEAPESDTLITPEEWAALESRKSEFDRKVDETLEEIRAKVEPGGKVVLTYWRSQVQMERYGLKKADFSQVNALSRAVAVILEHDGYAVEWSYPVDYDNPSRDERIDRRKEQEKRAEAGLLGLNAL